MENKKIIWTEEMSVGVKEIDEQHKFFVGLISELYTAINEKKLNNELDRIINSLSAYADLHFSTEEKYFDEFKYEFSKEHKQEHRDLKAHVSIFYDEFEKGNRDIAEALADFLFDWLVLHLATEDKKYTECFHEHGLY